MTLLDQVSSILKQYTGGSTPNVANATEHFDQVAQSAPQTSLQRDCRPYSAPTRRLLSVIWSAACSASPMANRKRACSIICSRRSAPARWRS